MLVGNLKSHLGVQVYPFILLPPQRQPLTAQLFLSLVGLHPDVVKAASVEDLVGTKAVRNRRAILSSA